MPNSVSTQRIEAVVTFVAMVAVVGLVTTNPSRAVSDVLTLADPVQATLIDPYVVAGYVVGDTDYCSDRTVFTA
jgi:hypothetical protein